MKNGSFSWLYTQFVSEAIFINIIIHETDMFGSNQTAFSSITYCTKEGEHGYSKHQHPVRSAFSKISDNIISVNYSDSIISIIGVIEYDNTLSFHSILNKENNGRASRWDVEIPHGLFVGEIKYESKAITTRAFVYQDKQYGNLPIQSFLNRWGWSITISNHITNGLFSVLSQDGSSITISFSCDGKSISKEATDTFDKKWVDKLKDLLYAPCNEYRIKNSNVYSRPIRQRIKEKHQGFLMTYCRYVCKTDSSICGVCEYMKID